MTSHIDTAWLWPFSVTQQKSARSWSTQCDLIDRYPEHRFSATQAQQFKWLEELYPSLFQRIKAKIAEGTFQPVGATWVEMDANMPSGEALCRQFLYGQRYFKSRFGKLTETFVLPDTCECHCDLLCQPADRCSWILESATADSSSRRMRKLLHAKIVLEPGVRRRCNRPAG